MAEITFGEAYGEAGPGARRGASIVHLAGGVVSLALIVGIGVWGGKIILRDVTGVPVVQAMSDGPMRIAPENPGGEVALHAGLTVNDVAALGEAGPPEDRLVLAPGAMDISEEDMALAEEAEADGDRPLNADEILALADRVAAEAEAEMLVQASVQMDVDVDVPDAPEEDPVAAALAEAIEAEPVSEPVPGPEVIAVSVPGVKRSIRPATRPRAILASAAVSRGAVTTPAALSEAEIPVSGELPVGTKLVQLGAFDSAELARTEWRRISGRFADFMAGKEPVIQQASTGGRTFFRLRAQGFADLSDARRFCAVLTAENAACIPVVVR